MSPRGLAERALAQSWHSGRVSAQPQHRRTGTLARWNDDRGFGFIRPDGSGDKLFVHVSAFGPIERRPIAGDRVRFSVTTDSSGRQQATEASIDGVARAAVMPRSDGLPRDQRRTPLGHARTALDVLALGTLVTVLALGLLVWSMPAWVVVLYGGMSLASLLLYFSDKRSAAAGGWRTPESTLHLIALAGGWPGAIVGQRALHHKTVKQEFRLMFWSTVAINLLALAVLVVPLDGSPLVSVEHDWWPR
nr:cold shock and DUF1294 domain-containing protein [Microcella alkalica]